MNKQEKNPRLNFFTLLIVFGGLSVATIAFLVLAIKEFLSIISI